MGNVGSYRGSMTRGPSGELPAVPGTAGILDLKAPQQQIKYMPSCIIKNHLYVGTRYDGMACKFSNPVKATHVLCLENSGRFPDEKSGLHFKMYPMKDDGNTNLEALWEIIGEFVIEGVQKRLVIHCHCGVNRSPVVALLYLIIEKKMTYESARKILMKKRPEMCIHELYEKQLQQISLKCHGKM